ncbi:MAG: hypothetical protein JXR30_03345 [Alphaproteobacteria bacterium]|nr:hypothetical protein [Alphaproteobacteria bacterium]
MSLFERKIKVENPMFEEFRQYCPGSGGYIYSAKKPESDIRGGYKNIEIKKGAEITISEPTVILNTVTNCEITINDTNVIFLQQVNDSEIKAVGNKKKTKRIEFRKIILSVNIKAPQYSLNCKDIYKTKITAQLIQAGYIDSKTTILAKQGSFKDVDKNAIINIAKNSLFVDNEKHR